MLHYVTDPRATRSRRLGHDSPRKRTACALHTNTGSILAVLSLRAPTRAASDCRG